MKTSITKKILILGLLILIPTFLYFYLKPEKKIEYITQDAIITDIEQIVSVNGTVESNSKIRLRFQTPGKIEKIFAKIGEKVKELESLANLDNEILQIQVEQATSNMRMSQADLNLRYAGPSSEEIVLSNTKIEQAEVNLTNAKTTYDDVLMAGREKIRKAELEIENAKIAVSSAEKSLDNSGFSTENVVEIAEKNLKASYVDSEPKMIISIDAIDRAISSADAIIGIDNKTANDDYEDRLGTKHKSANIDAIQAYSKAKIEFEKFKNDFESYNSQKTILSEEEVRIKKDLLLNLNESTLFVVKDLLDKTYFLLDQTPTNFIFTQQKLDELKAKIASEQSTNSTNLQSIQKIIQGILLAKLDLSKAEISQSSGTDDASSSLEKAKNNLLIAESNLKSVEVQNTIDENTAKMQIALNEVMLKQALASHDNLIAKPRAVDVASLKARVDSSMASIRQLQKELDNTIIKAPIDGVITEINSKVGENVSSAENVIVMITDKMQIKANISETDINKVSIGNLVDLSFDSLSEDELFKGKVILINPAETVVDGVIYYEATIVLENEDGRIKSGMTADMDIQTASRNQVVAIPALAVEYEDRMSHCFVLENGEKVKRLVKLGIEGNDMIEVIEGVKAGETIIIYEK